MKINIFVVPSQIFYYMKSFYLLLIILYFSPQSFAQSPIILTVDDIADINQEFLIGNSNPLAGFDETDTGADHIWDFSTLTAITHDTSKWVNVTDTDPLYFFLWLNADIAQQTGSDIVNDLITIEDVFNFYKRDDDQFSLTGIAGTISGIPLPIGYDDEEIILSFPAAYGDITTSETGFDIEIPGVASWKEQRLRTNEVDGWGTITTPGGTFEVLRLRSEINVIDTFIYDVVTLPVEYTSIEYRWIAKENGIPVLQINAIETLGTETTTQVFYKEGDINTGINYTASEAASLSIVKNPVEDNLVVEINNTADNFTIEIYDINGNIMFSEEEYYLSGKNNFTINISNLTNGLYFISMKQNGRLITSEKLFKYK